MKRQKLELTREGYCLTVVKISQTGNHSRVTIIWKLWWLTRLVFWWQWVVNGLWRLVTQGLLWLDLTLAVVELGRALILCGLARLSFQAELVGIMARSWGWALRPAI